MRGAAPTLSEGRGLVRAVLRDGSALDVFLRMLVKQGVSEADARQVCSGDPWAVLPRAKHVTSVAAARGGVVRAIAGLDVARACQALGAGRCRADQDIDLSVGVVLAVAVGDRVRLGDPVMAVHHAQDALPQHILRLLLDAVDVAPEDEQVSVSDRVIAILS